MSRSTAVDLATAVTYKALTIEELSIAYREAGVEYSWRDRLHFQDR